MHPGCRHCSECGVGSRSAIRPHLRFPHGYSPWKNVPVSGTADPNKEVTVTFGSVTLKTKADPQGKWSVTLPPMQPNATGRP